MKTFSFSASRRGLLRTVGPVALAAIGISHPASAASISETGAARTVATSSADALRALGSRLAAAPRRREFKTVPFMLIDPATWDHEAASEILSYKATALQVWDNSDIVGPWLGLMREAINGQAFTFGRGDFLVVSATHGEAHAALFPQVIWDKYNLPKVIGRKMMSNGLIVERPGVSPTDAIENVSGFYGPMNNNIVSLQRRGAVFIACHDTIHAFARTLGTEPTLAERSADEIAADLTNNLVPGVVLVPSVVAFLVELQRVGFTYVNAG